MILVPSSEYWGFLLERSVNLPQLGSLALIARMTHRPQKLLLQSEAYLGRVSSRCALAIPPVAPTINNF